MFKISLILFKILPPDGLKQRRTYFFKVKNVTLKHFIKAIEQKSNVI